MSGSVTFESVRKSYGTFTAIQNVDLAINEGELVSLLGPSGSGKSTLLMMLAGLEHPSHGDILVDGRSIIGVPANRRNLGMVFQKYTLFPHMTVAQNVAFPLEVRKRPLEERRERVEEALRVVRLDGYQDRFPKQLSGGQQQRIALARALVYDPPVLLMDEPFAALDRKLRLEMQDEIRRIRNELGLTIVFVTHDQEEALRISDRVAVLADGQVQQIDTPTAIYERPANSFVAQFIGNVSFLPVTVEAWDGDMVAGRSPDGRSVMFKPIQTNGSRAAPGSQLRLAVRPESLALAGNDGPDLLGSGVVHECIYLGEKTTCVLHVSGQPDIHIALGPHEPKPVAGETISFRLKHASVAAFGEGE